MLPATTERVFDHTTVAANRRIAEDTEERVRYFAHHPDQIVERLQELDQEWDIERAIEANAATLALMGIGLSVTLNRRWLALPALVTGFLLQHATQGWCPPVPVLRRLGYRTAREIDLERSALKALRGDFGGIENDIRDPEALAIRAMAAARA